MPRGIVQRQDRRSEKGRVHRAGPPDGEGANRDASGHLHDGEQAVLPGEGLRFHGDAEDGQRRHRCRHARQMGRAACARDHDLEALRLCALGEGYESVRRAVGRDDAGVIGNAQDVQGLGGMSHGRPIGLAAHDDGNGGSRHGVLRLWPVVYAGIAKASRPSKTAGPAAGPFLRR